MANWEPAAALYGGADGLDAYRRLAPIIVARLDPGGAACVEIGAGQADAVTGLFEAQGARLSPREDLAGVTRCLVVTLP